MSSNLKNYLIMKTLKTKLSIALSLVVLVAITAKAQTKADKCVSQGKIIIDAYYGFPYVIGNALNNASSSERVKNTNHLGGKFEIMANNVIGIGIDYTFARVTGFSNTVDYINENGQPKYIIGSFKESITKQRILLRMSVHFATTKNLDPYVSFGAGYKQSVYKNNYPIDYTIDNINLNLIPISFRAGIGMRYFFTENIGINIEGGFGGPVLQAGISAKF